MKKIIDFPTNAARQGRNVAAAAKTRAEPARVLLFTGVRYSRIEDAPRTEPGKRLVPAHSGLAGPNV